MELLSLAESIAEFNEQVSGTLQSWGYLGIFLACLMAASLLPAPSGVVFVLCVANPALQPALCVLFATMGNTCGSLILFRLGRLGKLRWLFSYGRVKREKVSHFIQKARRWGPPVALLSIIPGLGQAVIIALGFLHCNTLRTTFFIIIAKGLRYTIFALATLGFERMLGL